MEMRSCRSGVSFLVVDFLATAWHGLLRRTRGAPTCVAADCSRPHGLLRWSVFVVIVRDFTENVAINSDLRIVVHAERTFVPFYFFDLQ
jgi:hypothetical protein